MVKHSSKEDFSKHLNAYNMLINADMNLASKLSQIQFFANIKDLVWIVDIFLNIINRKKDFLDILKAFMTIKSIFNDKLATEFYHI